MPESREWLIQQNLKFDPGFPLNFWNPFGAWITLLQLLFQFRVYRTSLRLVMSLLVRLTGGINWCYNTHRGAAPILHLLKASILTCFHCQLHPFQGSGTSVFNEA